MSSEPEQEATPSSAADFSAATISKKSLKKDARNAEKAAKNQQQPAAEDPFAENYGDVLPGEILPKAISAEPWTKVGHLDKAAVGRSVLIRARAQTIRPVSRKMVFVVLRQGMSTVQCVLAVSADAGISAQMVRFAASLSKESVVAVEGVVSLPKEGLKSTTQEVEIQVRKLYCIDRADPNLPITVDDAARSELEFVRAEQGLSFCICRLERSLSASDKTHG